MAPRKAVASLQYLCLQKIRSAVLSTTAMSSVFDGAKRLETLRILLTSYIPKCHHSHISEVCIAGLASLYSPDNLNSSLPITNEFFKWREEIANLLFIVFSSVRPLIININQWSDLTVHKLIQQSDKLWSTQTFSSTDWMENTTREFIVKDVLLDGPVWMNLQSFKMLYCCSDKIISTIQLNSSSLRKLDVRYSVNVTDNCIYSLKKFRHLQHLRITETNITPDGVAHFLTESMSHNLIELDFLISNEGTFFEETLLQMAFNVESKELHDRSGIKIWTNSRLDVKRFKSDEFSEDVKFLPSYTIKKLRCRCKSLDGLTLRLLGKYFPSVSNLYVDCEGVMLNPGVLSSSLKKLEQCHIIVRAAQQSNTFLYPLPSAFMSIGSLLTALDVIFRDQSILDEITLTLPATCPNIVKLGIRQTVFYEEDPFSPPSVRFSSPPFLKLKSLTWTNCCFTSGVERILIHAHNIEKIHIKANFFTGCRFNEFLSNVIEFNTLSQLKKLKLMHSESTALSPEIFSFFLSNFQNLSIIKCNIDQDTRDGVESFIKENNYDVKLNVIPYEM